MSNSTKSKLQIDPEQLFPKEDDSKMSWTSDAKLQSAVDSV
jgi:hypothetical protein